VIGCKNSGPIPSMKKEWGLKLKIAGFVKVLSVLSNLSHIEHGCDGVSVVQNFLVIFPKSFSGH
jgi:hypothetical protein